MFEQTATYQELIQTLSPENIGRKVSEDAWRARHSFPYKSGVNDYQELIEELISYYQHHIRIFLRTNEDVPYHQAHGEVIDALRMSNLTIESAYFNSKNHSNGGLPGVLDALAQALERKSAKNYIDYVLETSVPNPWDYEAVGSIIDGFIRSHGQHLPYELRSREALMHNWKETLVELAATYSKLRSKVGRP